MVEYEQNRKEGFMKNCPFLNKACIKNLCMIWIEEPGDCAVPQILYSINLIKEDHLRVISRKFRDQE